MDAEKTRVKVAAIFRGEWLVVDDQAFVREVSRQFLLAEGASVTLAENGREAVDVVGRTRLSAILMDNQMPVMTGTEAITAIREDERMRGITPVPIILCTDDREIATLAIAVGTPYYIRKPVSEAAVRKQVERIAVDLLSAEESPIHPHGVRRIAIAIRRWFRIGH